MDINKVTLIGRLGRDPEVVTLSFGDKVKFSVATSDNWTDKATGEKKSKTQWHNIVVLNEPLGNFAKSYLKKGSLVYIEGALQTRDYIDPTSGEKKFVTEVVLEKFRGEISLLDSKNTSSTETVERNINLEDEIPF